MDPLPIIFGKKHPTPSPVCIYGGKLLLLLQEEEEEEEEEEDIWISGELTPPPFLKEKKPKNEGVDSCKLDLIEHEM